MINIKKTLNIAKIILRTSVLLSESKNFMNGYSQSAFYKPILKVDEFLKRLGIDYKPSANSYRIKQCPFCPKPHYNELSNLFTLNVNMSNGSFYCFRCQVKGSWNSFREKYLNPQGKFDLDIDSISANQFGDTIDNGVNKQISDVQYHYYIANLEKPEYADALNYLKKRGFTLDTLKKYKVGAGTQTFVTELGTSMDIQVIYFPMYQLAKKQVQAQSTNQLDQKQLQNPQQKLQTKLVKFKIRGASKENKKYTRQYPAGPHSGFFGLNTIQNKDKVIVITEGQFDAMAVNQKTGFPAISLPQGASNLPDSILPYLDRFTKIILWMDNDDAGKLGSQKISHKLGQARTYIVENNDSKLKDANDFLLHSPQRMKKMLITNKTSSNQNILRFSDIRQAVKNRIMKYQQFIGVKIDWLQFFNKKVKGIRMQQLSVVSGPTGCGKTTFLSQISLDLCKKQIPVLWGSFQIRNQVLATNMLMQYSGTNLFANKGQFDYWSEKFQNLPLYWLSFHGSHDVEKVLSTIEYSIQKNNVSFVVLDTLQFLLADQAEGVKKFDLQDKVMSRLRRIATNYKVHIVIVIHPRKTQDNEDIQIHSIYGTSKAAQQADNIWMIQNRSNFRIFQIKKNRFDGDIGKVAIGYNRQLKTFIQLTRSELSGLINNQMTMENIIQKRTQAQEKKEQFSLQQNQLQSYVHEDMISNKKKKKNY